MRQDRSGYQVRNRRDPGAGAQHRSAEHRASAPREDSAASYDRSRYRARNADEHPRRSYPERGSHAYEAPPHAAASSRRQVQAQRPASSSARRQRRSGQLPSSTRHQREHAGRQARQTPQGRGRGAHSAAAATPAIPLPALVLAALVVLALAVFGVSRCVGGAPQEQQASKGEGSSLPALELSAQKTEADYLPTPYMASCDGVKLHCAVRADQLTEVLIHNASYSYALPLKTKLTEATNVDVIAQHGTGRDANAQPTGDAWLTGEFIRCYRSTSEGPKLSAIDCGGPVGATVYAPVSGTVVKVVEYDLYNNSAYPDVRVHIQPEGRPDLDVVLIHLTDVSCKEGDVVEGGVTPIAAVRDVYAYIGDQMQLKDYTALGDNGNHTHIQVNDVTNKDYHGLD
ncbi:MAG: hypothetical protein ACI36W_03710 [Coriobacteriales bacterium]